MSISNTTSRPRISKLTLSIIFLAVVFLVTFLSKPALSLSTQFADGDQANSTLVVARQDATFRLEAPIATFTVFSPSSNFNVVVQEICTPYPYGNSFTYPVNETVRAWANDSNENAIGSEQTITTASCGSSLSAAVSGAQRTSRRGNINLYSATVTVTRNQTKAGAFRLVAPAGGYSTYREMPFSQATSPVGPANPYVSYGPSFAIVDRQFNYNNERSYTLRFGTDCNLSSNRTVYLKWEDADYGRSNEGGAVIRFDLYDDTVSTTVPILSRSGAQLNPSGVDGFYEEAGFTAIPNHKYRWVWSNVNGNNGIQIWMPFNQINYIANCGSWNHEPRLLSSTPARNSTVYPGDDIVITGDVTNPGTITSVNNTFDIYPSLNANRLAPQTVSAGGSWVSTYFARWSQGAIGAGGNSANRSARYRVNTGTPAGTQICFRTRVAPDAQGASGWDYTGTSNNYWCFTVGALNTWDYNPNKPTGPADTPTTPKPGQTLNLNSNARNTGNDSGPNYRHQIEVRRGAGAWSLMYDQVQPGFAPVNGPNRPDSYTIPNDASHNETFCFRTVVRNGSQGFGVAGNIRPPNTFLNTTANGPRYSTPLCYTAYNLRFDLDNDPNIGINAPYGAGAGQTITATYSINNNDGTELNNQFPTAMAGPSSNLNVRAQVTTGNASISGATNVSTGQISWGSSYQNSVSIQVDTDAEVGDDVCVRVFVNWEQGYSDGTSLANNPSVDETECFNVSDGPYLQVLEHDTWAGGGFRIGGGCSIGSSGEISSHARSRVQSNGTPIAGVGVGAMDEYALFAQGDINNFGSSNDPLDDLLSFANNTNPAGNFNAQRCISGVFDGGGAGGVIDDGLWQNATDISSINSNTINDGQYRIDGDASYTSSGQPFNSFDGNATILVNGDLNITRNIQLDMTGMSPGNIPFLLFIVNGDINIADNVSRIDGVYISNATINTCDDGGLVNGALVADGPCSDHLEVNGSLIANNIAFRRTHGGTNEAATSNNLGRCRGNGGIYNSPNLRCAGETIIFPIWFWLAEPHFNHGGGPEANQYPIQQLRDLPPIF